MSRFKNNINKLLKTLLPDRCLLCYTAIDKEAVVCKKCEKEINIVPVYQAVPSGYRCASAFLYKGKFKRAVLNFKFHNKVQYSQQLAYFIYKTIERSFPDAVFDVITYVPMHHKSFSKRGYNQCQLIARDLSQLMGIECVETLTKIKDTKPQHTLSGRNRKLNLKGAFKVVDKKLVQGRSILVIDDVITTGSTLYECSKTLQKAKPLNIFCATVLASGNLY